MQSLSVDKQLVEATSQSHLWQTECSKLHTQLTTERTNSELALFQKTTECEVARGMLGSQIAMQKENDELRSALSAKGAEYSLQEQKSHKECTELRDLLAETNAWLQNARITLQKHLEESGKTIRNLQTERLTHFAELQKASQDLKDMLAVKDEEHHTERARAQKETEAFWAELQRKDTDFESEKATQAVAFFCRAESVPEGK